MDLITHFIFLGEFVQSDSVVYSESLFCILTGSRTIVNITAAVQKERNQEEYMKCLKYIAHHPKPDTNETYCPRVWDGVLCWPDTSAGKIASQPCPGYVNGFKAWENATRRCMPDGTWYFDFARNRTWTDLSFCSTKSDDEAIARTDFIKAHMGKIRLMYNVGYGVSLASLVLSVLIMVSFKKLHCPRNNIHVNLFISFILRASISFMKENLLVGALGFPGDVIEDGGNSVIFKNGSLHWECKLFFTCFHYILGANYMWIFAEALYLHILISVAVFSENSSVKWYALLGWVSPILFVLPWVVVRATLEDEYCWNTHPTPGYFWIMRGPIVLSIVVNFMLFLNIMRVLFTKLSAVNSPEAKKYRKLAKSTLVLIPLFGVHYIVFAWLPKDVNRLAELIQLYFEMFFNSVQGFFVALLFCFLNGEVQSEIKKKWHRFRLTHLNYFPDSRKDSNNQTYATYLSRGRDSNVSVAQFQEARDSPLKSTVKSKHVHSLHQDSSSALFPMKTRLSVKTSTGSNVISELDEAQPMISQARFTTAACQSHKNGLL
ncbi:hypothetical protein BsWGS_05457 [Bradybaena similaris]